MKAMDIHFMVKELQDLVGAKVDKIFQKNDEFIISLHKKGKILLKVSEEAAYITNYKFTQERPPAFCMYLRKHLNQARITEIIQRGFDRIIEVRLNKKDDFILIIELFSKGNLILCEPNFKIMSALHNQEWKDRTIKPKVTYHYPPRLKHNPLKVKEEYLDKLGKENLVKTLAIDFGLGGSYAEEVCLRAKVDKNKKTLTKEEKKKLVKSIKTIADEKPNPNIFKDDIYSFKLKIHKGEQKPFKTLSEALDNYYKNELVEDKTFKKRMKKAEKVLKKQKKHLEGLKKTAENDKIRGDLIYNNYSYIEEVLKTIKDARDKKVSWEEITKKLKTKKIEVIKGGKVLLDLK